MMQTIELVIEGMSCNGCVGSVTRVLKAMPGVADVTVTLLPPRAHVTFDPAIADRGALAAAVEDAGYAVGA
jgi:copper chaperone